MFCIASEVLALKNKETAPVEGNVATVSGSISDRDLVNLIAYEEGSSHSL